MQKIIFSLFDNENIGNMLAKNVGIEKGNFQFRYFPDGEIYIKIESDVKNKSVILLCFLDHPNNKILALYFLAQTLKELEANKITLIVPYLPYMRQDKKFNNGEALTSIFFAKLISSLCHSLITIDPHLHRIKDLSDIYSIPTKILHCNAIIAGWIKKNINSPVIIGPDEESAQWVSEIATLTDAKYVIATKQRLADKKVIIDLPNINENNYTPVIVDDIISSGTTLHAVIDILTRRNYKNPICIGIHALINKDNYKKLTTAGAKDVISSNTIFHHSNKINIFELLLEGVRDC